MSEPRGPSGDVDPGASEIRARRRGAGRTGPDARTWATFGLVLLASLIYVGAARSVDDPVRYVTPLMLLFPAGLAGWFLRPWMLGVHLLVVPVACLVAVQGSYDDVPALVFHVVVGAGVLDGASLGVFLLRRRFERLLDVTRAASRRDPLTGLHNRRYLAEQADRVWRQARRDGTRVAAMVLDLDHFKLVNDTHGHAAGDAVLRVVAAALTATVRPADLLARTGGEELLVVSMVSDEAEAGHLAERLRRAVATARTAEGHGVTASIGVSLLRPVDGEDAAASLWRLVDRADAAMYEAKRSGRDRVAPIRLPQLRQLTRGLRATGTDPSH